MTARAQDKSVSVPSILQGSRQCLVAQWPASVVVVHVVYAGQQEYLDLLPPGVPDQPREVVRAPDVHEGAADGGHQPKAVGAEPSRAESADRAGGGAHHRPARRVRRDAELRFDHRQDVLKEEARVGVRDGVVLQAPLRIVGGGARGVLGVIVGAVRVPGPDARAEEHGYGDVEGPGRDHVCKHQGGADLAGRVQEAAAVVEDHKTRGGPLAVLPRHPNPPIALRAGVHGASVPAFVLDVSPWRHSFPRLGRGRHRILQPRRVLCCEVLAPHLLAGQTSVDVGHAAVML
mmetsp:Transcript_2851/g.9609  ORF Transcript_2851/g.9609 Transcript_2851/m.9609 type:complete len:289 (-) Transcript_2851:239-1105(-)